MQVQELLGQRVKVHWHFTRKMYSVSYMQPGIGWRVARDDSGDQWFFGKVVLRDVNFNVQPGNRARARKAGVRNVHATMIGELLDFWLAPAEPVVPCGLKVMYSYDAYEEPEFKVQPPWTLKKDGTMHSTDIAEWPGITWAEFAALGCKSNNKPVVLVAGALEVIERDEK